MARPINDTCKLCSTISFRKKEAIKPKCWHLDRCKRKRSYYKRLDYYRTKQRQRHVYLKYCADKCAMCESTDRLEVHHITPQSLGGEHTRMNTLTLCYECHKTITRYQTIVYGRSVSFKRNS